MSGREICGVNESSGGHRRSLLHYAAYCCCCFYCAPAQPSAAQSRARPTECREGDKEWGEEEGRALLPFISITSFPLCVTREETCGRVISCKPSHTVQREVEEHPRAPAQGSWSLKKPGWEARGERAQEHGQTTASAMGCSHFWTPFPSGLQKGAVVLGPPFQLGVWLCFSLPSCRFEAGLTAAKLFSAVSMCLGQAGSAGGGVS